MSTKAAPGSKKLPNGSKAKQRTGDTENRAWQFSDKLREYGISATDKDYWIWGSNDAPRLIVEVTRRDITEEQPKLSPFPTGYLEAIDRRRTDDGNDRQISRIAKFAGVPAILALFETDINDPEGVIWVRPLTSLQWEKFPTAEFFEKLKLVEEGGELFLGTGVPLKQPFVMEEWEQEYNNGR
jgi:hypothetical protein